MLSFLEYLDGSIAVAFRAEFDATVLERELHDHLGIRTPLRFLDLAVVLPALFPGTPNDTLDDWAGHFGLSPIGRHHAIADAYANASCFCWRSTSRNASACARRVTRSTSRSRSAGWGGVGDPYD